MTIQTRHDPRTISGYVPSTSGVVYSDRSVTWDFDSLASFADAAERSMTGSDMSAASRSSMRSEKRDGSGGYGRRTGWFRSESLPDALAIARTGWPEGRAAAEAFTAKITNAVRGRMKVTEYESVTVGPIFDLGAYLQDDPQFMMVTTDSERDMSTGSVVRIVLDVGVSAGVDADTLIRRGAAVLALVDALESQGRRCEVTATYGAGMAPNGCVIRVVVKRAGDYVNMDVLAFAVAHPSSFRRLGFAVYESMNASLRSHHGIGGGYGQARGDATVPADVRIAPADLYTSRVWEDETKAAAEVVRMLREQGIELGE